MWDIAVQHKDIPALRRLLQFEPCGNFARVRIRGRRDECNRLTTQSPRCARLRRWVASDSRPGHAAWDISHDSSDLRERRTKQEGQLSATGAADYRYFSFLCAPASLPGWQS
jgi:hypothetical protein